MGLTEYGHIATEETQLRGPFSTLERKNSTGTYRVYFDSGSIACQKKNGDSWDSPGFLARNYGVSPPETWLKVARIGATASIDTPGIWLTGAGQALHAENGLKYLNIDRSNRTAFEWVRDGAISRWVLCSKSS